MCTCQPSAMPIEASNPGGRSPPRRCRPVRRRRLGWAVRNCKRPQGIASHDRVNRDWGHVCIDPGHVLHIVVLAWSVGFLIETAPARAEPIAMW